jgi:hypothetical protein
MAHRSAVRSLPIQLFMMQFPRADIHENLTADLLHQVIKGAFKDHLVAWVEDYLQRCMGLQRLKVFWTKLTIGMLNIIFNG